MSQDVRTYRGSALEELLPRIREELGDDAVILQRREGAEGGVGGFFAKRVVEVDAMAAPRFSRRDDEEDGLWDEPEEPAYAPPSPPVRAGSVRAAAAPSIGEVQEPEPEPEADAAEPRSPFARALHEASERPAPPAPAHRPTPAPSVPELEDLLHPDRRHELARLFEAGLPATSGGAPPAPPEPAPPEPAPEAVAPEPQPMAPQPEAVAPEPQRMAQEPAAAAPEPAPAVLRPEAVPPQLAPASPEPEAVEPEPEPARVTTLAAVPQAPATLPARRDAPLPPAVLALEQQGLSPAFALALLEQAETHLAPFADPAGGATDLSALLRRALAARIPIASSRVGPTGGVIGFAGPGGAGKTRCVARLATAYAQRSTLPVACVSLRPADGGAELTRLLADVEVPVHAEPDGRAAAARVAELRGHALVLLDTPGVSPRADAELRTLAADLAAVEPDELHLTVPATAGARAARELLGAGRRLGATAMAITHADETEGLGTPVELAVESELPISYLSRGPVRPVAADELAAALVA